jgi:hypothetical protein
VPALLEPRLGGAEAEAAGDNELGGVGHNIQPSNLAGGCG